MAEGKFPVSLEPPPIPEFSELWTTVQEFLPAPPFEFGTFTPPLPRFLVRGLFKPDVKILLTEWMEWPGLRRFTLKVEEAEKLREALAKIGIVI